jgi:hypothetical protein
MVGRVVFLFAAVIAFSHPASADPASGTAIDAPVPQYLAIGLGISPLDGAAVSFQIGREFHPHVAWFDELDAVINDRGDVPTAQNVTQLVLVTGARWMPFPKSPDTLLQLAGVYLKAGLALEVRPSLDASPGLAFAAGYLPLQGARWALGAEADTGLALWGTGHRAWSCTLVFELTN